MEVKIDTTGKAILPKALRAAADLDAGSVAEARVTPEGLLLVPQGRSKRRNTFLDFVEESRRRDRGPRMNREEILRACDHALEGLAE